MPNIRIAQKAWKGMQHATEMGPDVVGLDLMWVEIDGHRIDWVHAAEIRAASREFSVPEITVAIIGTVEIVYVDKDGNEIGHVHADPAELADTTYEHRAILEQPPEADVDRAIRERDEARREVERLLALLGDE